MRAVLLHSFGGPEELVLANAEGPTHGQGDVLITVRSAGINFADVLIRRGAYAQPPSLPTIVGNEVAGEVLVGDPDGRFATGERVMALTLGGGGYAEVVAAPVEHVFPLPPQLSYEDGATLLMAGCTALLALESTLRLREGETVLIHGAGGGVGAAAVQVARSLGGRVIGTATSQERLALVADLGADAVIDRSSAHFVGRVRAAAGARGVDAVIDPLGGEVLVQSLALLRPFGRLVSVGEAAGSWPDLEVARLVGRNIGVHGVYLARAAKHAPETVRAAGERISALARDGVLRSPVSAVFPLADAARAHQLIESRRHVGKLALSVP